MLLPDPLPVSLPVHSRCCYEGADEKSISLCDERSRDIILFVVPITVTWVAPDGAEILSIC